MKTSWPTLAEEVFACQKCRLCQTRNHVVLGEGNLHAPLMFIGEGPVQRGILPPFSCWTSRRRFVRAVWSAGAPCPL